MYFLRSTMINKCFVSSGKVAATAKSDIIISAKAVNSFLSQSVVGQEKAKLKLSVALANHYRRIHQDKNDPVRIEKSNILLIGPTGCGKTLLSKSMAQYMKVPFLSVDATLYTAAGYVGDNVSDILSSLLRICNYRVKEAEKGIVFIDEVDKIAGQSRLTESPHPIIASEKDVGGRCVQQALLKMVEGASIKVVAGLESVMLNTDNILFIFSGSFSELQNRVPLQKDSSLTDDSFGDGNYLKHKDIEHSHLVSYGMIPEFIGRIPIIAQLGELSLDDLVNTLYLPVNSILRQYQKIFELGGVKLIFRKDALYEVARIAQLKGLGARGLRSILEDVLLPEMYNLETTLPTSVISTNEKVLHLTKEKIVLNMFEKMAGKAALLVVGAGGNGS